MFFCRVTVLLTLLQFFLFEIVSSIDERTIRNILPDNLDKNRERFYHDRIGRKVAADVLEPYGGCVNPNNPDRKVRSGETTMICIVISSGGSWADGMTYRRYTFSPIADDANYFVIQKSYLSLVKEPNFHPNVMVHVESQKELSFLRQYYDADNDQIFPFLTAIINVHKGEVVGITWDEACIFCYEGLEPERCVENTYDYNGGHPTGTEFPTPSTGCWLSEQECDATTIPVDNGPDGTLETVCTLGIHFVWTGTDEKGVALNSYGARRSAFLKSPVYPDDFDALKDMWPKNCEGKFCGKSEEKVEQIPEPEPIPELN